jgi:hypothetical protein
MRRSALGRSRSNQTRTAQVPSQYIEGEAKGADSLARDVALELGFKVLSFPADWDKYHRAAGPIRNRQMLTEGKPDLVLAFHQDLTRSKGTKNMVTLARRALGDDKVLIFES